MFTSKINYFYLTSNLRFTWELPIRKEAFPVPSFLEARNWKEYQDYSAAKRRLEEFEIEDI